MTYHMHSDGSAHENCSCGHDHEHKQDIGAININEHDGALICSMDIGAGFDFYDIKKTMIAEMERLSDFIVKNGGLIGHIKAFIKCSDAWAQISITKQKAYVTESEKNEGDNCSIQFTAIVFNINADNLLSGLNIMLKKIKNE